MKFDSDFKNKSVAGIVWLAGLYLFSIVTTNLEQIFQGWQEFFAGSSDFFALGVTTFIVLSPISLGVIGYLVLKNIRSLILPPLAVHVLIAATSPMVIAVTGLLVYWWFSFDADQDSAGA